MIFYRVSRKQSHMLKAKYIHKGSQFCYIFNFFAFRKPEALETECSSTESDDEEYYRAVFNGEIPVQGLLIMWKLR